MEVDNGLKTRAGEAPHPAVVYCEGAYTTSNGKTAHGLVRFTRRYQILAVVDSTCADRDAGTVLDGQDRGIPIVDSIAKAIGHSSEKGVEPTHVVVGLAPDGGRLPLAARLDLLEAVRSGLNVDSGLHDFLSEDQEFLQAAREHGVQLRDVRKPPPRNSLHFFSGKIEEVTSFRIALLGTDSAVGKRTTAWLLVQALEKAGRQAEMVGTGQTAWMQGSQYGIILDSLINDFVAGEIEHAVWKCWSDRSPDVIVIEGQGSLMNPAYPGGYEILAAGRPNAIILQHAPSRRDYDGFPGYPIHPLTDQIKAIELISGRQVIGVTINREHLDPASIPDICRDVEKTTGRPAFDVLGGGLDGLRDLVIGAL